MHETDNLVANTWCGPFNPPASIPDAADVVIIGGGIIGISTAWFLTRQGIKVVVCEKGHVAGEQSSRNWGWVRRQMRDPREMPLMVESLRLWNAMAEDLGEDVGFRAHGIMIAARTDNEAQACANWLEIGKQYDVEARFVEGDELEQLVPGATVDWKGALYTPGDGRAEPHLAAPAIARAAARKGAQILTACAARGIETTGGAVSAVVTEHGAIKTSQVLCAAGAWTSMFCRSLGITLPQLKVRGTVARTAPAEAIIDGNFYDSKIALRRREDGGYTVAHGTILDHAITPSTFRFARQFLPALISEMDSLRVSIGREFFDEWRAPKTWPLDQASPFEEQRVLNPVPNPKAVKGIRENLAEVFPALADVELVETWAGMVETTPDVIPVIDEVDAIPGFFVATGLSGHGFGIAPGAGKAIAGLLTGRDSGLRLEDFRLSRFTDGTKLELYGPI